MASISAWCSRFAESALKGWQPLAPIRAGAREENAVAVLRGLIYVVAGFDQDRVNVSRVEAYDPESDAWTEVAPLPREVHHPNAAVVGDRLYVLGALTTLNFTALGSTYVYDPDANSWSELSPMPAGTERGAGAAAAIGDKIFVAGGLRGNRSVADFTAYDTVSDTWEILPSLDEPLDHLVAGAVGGKFYKLGGVRNGSLRGNVDEFDPDTLAWTAKTPMLTPRSGPASAVIENRIIVAGGQVNPRVETGVFDENEIYDPANDTWEALEPMATPRHGTGGAAVGNVFYVPGGGIRRGFSAVDTNESFALPSVP